MTIELDDLANEIRRVDGDHNLGAGALAEALLPWLVDHGATPSDVWLEGPVTDAAALKEERQGAVCIDDEGVVRQLRHPNPLMGHGWTAWGNAPLRPEELVRGGKPVWLVRFGPTRPGVAASGATGAPDADRCRYGFGTDSWPGLAKLVEEAGEVVQVAAKLLGTGGRLGHWDGTNLARRLEEELGDLRAAIDFFVAHNSDQLDTAAIRQRTATKVGVFEGWHDDGDPSS